MTELDKKINESIYADAKGKVINKEELLRRLDEYQDKAESEYHWCDEVVSDIFAEIGEIIDALG